MTLTVPVRIMIPVMVLVTTPVQDPVIVPVVVTETLRMTNPIAHNTVLHTVKVAIHLTVKEEMTIPMVIRPLPKIHRMEVMEAYHPLMVLRPLGHMLSVKESDALLSLHPNLHLHLPYRTIDPI